jgi:hypothetical protein
MAGQVMISAPGHPLKKRHAGRSAPGKLGQQALAHPGRFVIQQGLQRLLLRGGKISFFHEKLPKLVRSVAQCGKFPDADYFPN